MKRLVQGSILAVLVVASSGVWAKTQNKVAYKCTTTSVTGMATNDSSRSYFPTQFRPEHRVKWLVERDNSAKDDTYVKDKKMYALNDKKEYRGSSLVDFIIDGGRTLHSVYFSVNNYSNYNSSFVMDKNTGSFILYGTTESGRDWDSPIAYIETGKCQKW